MASTPASTGVTGPAGIRTLALVGQTASGKTSLAEALLHRAGAIGAPGSLERGTTVSDFDPMERKAQHSLNAALLHLHHHDTRIHLIDTPGYADFVGQSMTALEAVETAAIVGQRFFGSAASPRCTTRRNQRGTRSREPRMRPWIISAASATIESAAKGRSP